MGGPAPHTSRTVTTRNLEIRDGFRVGVDPSLRARRARRSLLALVLFWGSALLVMIDDIDFFDLHDLFDMTRLHHEHFVVALLALGAIVAAWPYARAWRAARAPRWSAPPSAPGPVELLAGASPDAAEADLAAPRAPATQHDRGDEGRGP